MRTIPTDETTRGVTHWTINGRKFAVWRARTSTVLPASEYRTVLWWAHDVDNDDLLVAGARTKTEVESAIRMAAHKVRAV